jgi:hypothetical protein
MGAKSADDVSGLEFDWLAGDADGNVGFFSTGGGGYAPEDFLLNTDAHDQAIDAILALPARTTVGHARQLAPTLQNTWQMMAERGIFAFDSDPNGGPYRLVASPAVPVRVAELPEAAAAVIRQLSFRHLRFTELQEVPAALLAKGG